MLLKERPLLKMLRSRVRQRLEKRLGMELSGGREAGDDEIEIPEPVYKYALGVSKVTGLPLSEVLQSRPVQNLMNAYQRKIRVKLSELN